MLLLFYQLFTMNKTLFIISVFQTGFDQAYKERMGPVWSGFKFRMELYTDIKWMVNRFYRFHKLLIRAGTGNQHSVVFKITAIIVIEFETMAMSFINYFLFVQAVLQTFRTNGTRIASQAHRTSFSHFTVLVFHKVNDRIFA